MFADRSAEGAGDGEDEADDLDNENDRKGTLNGKEMIFRNRWSETIREKSAAIELNAY